MTWVASFGWLSRRFELEADLRTEALELACNGLALETGSEAQSRAGQGGVVGRLGQAGHKEQGAGEQSHPSSLFDRCYFDRDRGNMRRSV